MDESPGEQPGAPIHVVSGASPQRLEIHGQGGQVAAEVLAAGHDSPKVTANLARNFQRGSRRGVPIIGVLHTQVTSASGADGHQPYAPSTAADLMGADLDYWALGHVHVRGRVDPSVPAYYPGNLQGRNVREAGPKGGLLVEVDEHGLVHEPEFVPLAPVEFFRCRGSFGARATPEELGEHVLRSLEEARVMGRGPVARELVVRCEVGGAFAPELRRLEISGELNGFQEAALGELAALGAEGVENVEFLELELRASLGPPTGAGEEEAAEAWRAALEGSPSAMGRALTLCDELEQTPKSALDWLPDSPFAGRLQALLEEGQPGALGGLSQGLLTRLRAGRKS